MSNPNQPVAVSILGKEYRIACEPGTEDELISAARFLDTRMREVRGTGKVIGTDRIAVMVALNLAHELLQEKSEQDSAASSSNKRIRALRERIEIALNDSTQLEL
ncbi:MAG: cell division protein ZapA [Chromatiaceae bacterium]|nr:cell division protein ZapA [Gammaproteobacteria bacterium]MCP5304831.1 cell division protein ZapA [Chromatiaceae bacterium]MCP5314790.1 cell division protein ZapA [Chromatiaceae bacterium]